MTESTECNLLYGANYMGDGKLLLKVLGKIQELQWIIEERKNEL